MYKDCIECLKISCCMYEDANQLKHFGTDYIHQYWCFISFYLFTGGISNDGPFADHWSELSSHQIDLRLIYLNTSDFTKISVKNLRLENSDHQSWNNLDQFSQITRYPRHILERYKHLLIAIRTSKDIDPQKFQNLCDEVLDEIHSSDHLRWAFTNYVKKILAFFTPPSPLWTILLNKGYRVMWTFSRLPPPP